MYWGIPPEVNAFRLTLAGAGPTAHIPHVTGFETAAATHMSQATQMAATAVSTATSFVGLGGAAMMEAALGHTAWMMTAAAHAEKAAATIGAGIDAYGAAVAATIPFPTVVANRMREAVLEATNILGQNTPAIAETNAEYGQYWAQNAGSMMGYLTAVTGLLGSLATPLPVMPTASNPAAAMAAGAAAMGMSLGLQGAGIALGAGTQAGTSVASTGAGVATTGAGVAAGSAASAGQGAQAGQAGSSPAGPPAAEVPGPGGGQQLDAGQALGPAQSMMGSVISAPSMASSSVGSMLSQAQSLPSAMGGQLTGLMSPALSAASGGFGGGGTPGLGAWPISAAGSPWSGLSGANGGFAGGGSAVSAMLTKPSAGAGMAGPMGVPSAWWSNTGVADKAVAGVRGAGSAPAAGPMGSGMYGMPFGAGGSQQRKNRDPGQADKSVLVDDGVGDAVPVYTDGGVVYVQGQEV